jgi:N-acetylneuraminic acid mutarotase
MDAGFQLTNDWYRFNMLTNSWSPVASLPAAGRQYCSSFVIDGAGFLFGGIVNGTATNELWRYEPATDTWTQRASNTDSCSASTAFTLEGAGHVVSGNLANGLPSNFHWVYDPAGDEWTMAGPLPGPPLHRAASFVHEGTAWLTGGSVAPLFAVAESYAYLPMIAMWETRAALPEPRFSGDAVGVPDGGVFVCGGTYDPPSVAHDEVWHYEAATDIWQAYPSFPAGTRRGGVIAFVPPDKVFYGTGSDNAVRYRDWWMLELPVGITEFDPAPFILSPVPADALLNVKGSTPGDPFSWSIADTDGRVLQMGQAIGGHTGIPTSDLSPGMYIIRFKGIQGTAAKRFTVVH